MKRRQAGRGIAVKQTEQWAFAEVFGDGAAPEAKQALREFADSWRWQSESQLIMDNVVAEYLTKAHGAPPDGGWREYEDPEWFALAIEKDWQFVAKMVAAGDANAAARFSVRLGWKLAILLSKLGVEDDWQWGRDKRAASSGGGSKGGEATDPDNDAGVAVMAEVLPGLTGHGRISKAARIAAKQIGKPTKAGAIRAAYNRRCRKLDAS